MHTECVSRRLSIKEAGVDFMSKLLGNPDFDDPSVVQIASHASDIILAGSDTTAVTLSTIQYFLSRKPLVLKTLQAEVRSSFKDYGAINARGTSSLKYLHAVCLEALRVYPPVPLGLPRVVPKDGDTVDQHYIPPGVSPHLVSTSVKCKG